MRIYKDLMAKYNAILEEYPDVKLELQGDAGAQPQPKAEEQKVSSAAAATSKCTLSLEEIYEKYHNMNFNNIRNIL